MMSREFLKRMGVFGVVLGLTVAPLSFADDRDKEDKNGDYGQSGESTMQDGAATGAAGGETQQGDADWEEGQDDATSGTANGDNGNGDGTASNPTDAGGVGIEGHEGTQAGDEPDPENETDTDTDT